MSAEIQADLAAAEQTEEAGQSAAQAAQEPALSARTTGEQDATPAPSARGPAEGETALSSQLAAGN